MIGFQIHEYTLTLGRSKMPGMGEDPNSWAIGGFRCRQQPTGGDFLDIAFMPEGVTLPANTSNGAWHTLYRPASELPYYMDLLRNERPVHAEVDPKNPIHHKISSGYEVVGEGE